MTQQNQRGFFLSFVIMHIYVGMAYIFLANLFALLNNPSLDLILRFYPFRISGAINIMIMISAIIIIAGSVKLWNLKYRGWKIYLVGKILLGGFIIYSIILEYHLAGMVVHWLTILLYCIMWAIFPLIIYLHLNRLTK